MIMISSARRRTAIVMTALLVAASAQLAVPSPASPLAGSASGSKLVKLVPRHDAEVYKARPSLNRGSSRRFRPAAEPRRVAFIKFKVPARLDSMEGARLLLSVSSTTDTRLIVRRAGRKWREAEVTYDTAPPIRRRLGTINVAAGRRRWVSVDVSRYVNGPGVYSFAVVGLGEVAAVVRSSESASPPRLVLRIKTTTTPTTTTRPPTTTTATTTTHPPPTTTTTTTTHAPPATTQPPPATTTTTTTQPPATTTTTTQAPPNRAVMVAAGDIACSPSNGNFNGGQGTSTYCRQSHTSDLALAVNPDAVATLGDLQYDNGELNNFTQSYAPSWGRLFGRTHPAAGNHEYNTANAAGYFAYWGARAGSPGKGYYSYDVGSWHAVVLNTNCGAPDVDCSAGGAQAAWMRADLATSGAECTIAYGHHPRFSSGQHGDETAIAALYAILYDNGVDVYLAGHDHHYERTAPLKPNATVGNDGIRNFIVGTGGAALRRDSVNPRSHTEAWNDQSFGVLRLDLLPGSYEWEFINDGSSTFSDAGTGSCH